LNDFLNSLNKILTSQTRTLPYPEEAPDYDLSLTSEQLLQQFFDKYFIPHQYWDFWKKVTIVIDKNLPYPAGMISETRTLLLKPEYANPGILAHEFSHLSYAQLDNRRKTVFISDYSNTLQSDGLLKFLYSQKQYMQTNIVEAHAEIFRYLGINMPGQLKKYYPYLI
jgi:hypothetical protein